MTIKPFKGNKYLDPSNLHTLECGSLDPYITTKVYQEAANFKEIKSIQNSKCYSENRFHLITEVAVKSLIGFMGIIQLYEKGETPTLDPETLKIAITFAKEHSGTTAPDSITPVLERMKKNPPLYGSILLYAGKDYPDNMPNLFLKFFSGHRNIPSNNLDGNTTWLSLKKPIPLKKEKQR